MNLILNIFESRFSVVNSDQGNSKVHSAIAEAMDNIKRQALVNKKRVAKGLEPYKYNVVINDEYGKELVTIKETKNLSEIRNEYQKKMENSSYEKKEKVLLSAMSEIGNSPKSEREYKEELNKVLNSSLFITDTTLTPGLEKILDYFGSESGLVNSIDFKQDISKSCIRELIDMPNPNTGKPPKTFEQLMQNIVSISTIFKNNPLREEYLETVRSYVNIRYRTIIPSKYKNNFESIGNLKEFLNKLNSEKQKLDKINNLGFEVSEKNFKSMYQTFIKLEQFKGHPEILANYLIQRVPEKYKESFNKWMNSIGCVNPAATITILNRWEAEKDRGLNNTMDKKRIVEGTRSE